MYRFTKDEIWWKRALQYGCLKFDQESLKAFSKFTKVGRKVQGVSDYPYSL